MKNKTFHKNFRLNGNHFANADDLLNYSKALSSCLHGFLSVWFDDKEFIIVKTSGSTGTPKIIQLKKEHMVNSAMATGTYFNLSAKTTTLLCLSIDFIAGKMMLVRALTMGWHLDVVKATTNPLQNIEKTYDFSAMVPLQAHNSIDKLSQIKKLIIGGGVVSKELQVKLMEVSTEVFATYGMTETITHIAVKPLNNFEVISTPSSSGEKSHYQVLPNISISKDSRGCLVINAPSVSDEQIITNDVVEIISETEFKWLGRYDNIINSGGVKLIPEQIEEKLSAVINCRFFVSGIPDEILGEKLILVIERAVISNKERNLITSQISNLKSLTKYETPKDIYFLPKFADTETKKIQRQQTLDLILN